MSSKLECCINIPCGSVRSYRTLTGINDQLRKTFDEIIDYLEKYDVEVEDLESANKDLEDENKELRNEVDNLTDQIIDLETDNDILREENYKLEDKIYSHEAELDELHKLKG